MQSPTVGIIVLGNVLAQKAYIRKTRLSFVYDKLRIAYGRTHGIIVPITE